MGNQMILDMCGVGWGGAGWLMGAKRNGNHSHHGCLAPDSKFIFTVEAGVK